MSKKKIKVLFIGNSHTYFNDMPYIVEYISKYVKNENNNMIVKSTMLSDGGRSLIWQATQLDVRYNIIYGNYDYIILQDHAHPFEGYNQLAEGILALKEFINQALSKPKVVLYMTWSKKDKPEDFAEMKEAYIKASENFNFKLAPVGERFELINQNPKVNLYVDDNSHASYFGSYIVALTLLETIFDKSINKLPQTIEFGEKILYTLSDEELKILNKI